MTATGTEQLDAATSASIQPTAEISRPKPALWEVLLFLYLPFLVVVLLTFPTTADDPFITLRYAANLVHGYGPVYNPGQHVQGFTSPLHLLVAVVAYLLPGGHALFKLKLASLVFGVLALREGSILLSSLSLPVWARRVGFVALGTSLTLAFASVNALETSLVIWLLIALVRRLVVSGPPRSGLTPTILAFALVLARFDSLFPMAAMALAGLWVHRSLSWWKRISWVQGAIASALISVVGQYLYYGFPFPNTYYAKTETLTQGLHEGWLYLGTSVVPTLGQGGIRGALAVVVVIVEIALFGLGLVSIWRRNQRCLYLVAVVVGQLLLIFKAGGDWMVGGRFFAPAVISAIGIEILGVVEGASLLRSRQSPGGTRAVQVLGSAGLIAASFLPFTGQLAPVWQLPGLDDRSILADGHFPLSSPTWAGLPTALHCVKPGQLIATTEAGYLGFARQDVRILDMRGLTNQDIGHANPQAAIKDSQGVTDLFWPDPSSVVGHEILKERPSIIVTFDWPYGARPTIEQPVLGGAYHFLDDLTLGGSSIGVFGLPSVNPACFADLGRLRSAIARTISAKTYQGLLVIESGGRYQVRYFEFQPPDRALLRLTNGGQPVEIDIGGTRYSTSPLNHSTYTATPIVPGSTSLPDLPRDALSLFSDGTPGHLDALHYVVHVRGPVPTFLQSTLGSGSYGMTVTGTVYYRLVRESIAVTQAGHPVTATLYFYKFNALPPISAPS
jgi:arabinofuranosyltransferase